MLVCYLTAIRRREWSSGASSEQRRCVAARTKLLLLQKLSSRGSKFLSLTPVCKEDKKENLLHHKSMAKKEEVTTFVIPKQRQYSSV